MKRTKYATHLQESIIIHQTEENDHVPGNKIWKSELLLLHYLEVANL